MRVAFGILVCAVLGVSSNAPLVVAGETGPIVLITLQVDARGIDIVEQVFRGSRESRTAPVVWQGHDDRGVFVVAYGQAGPVVDPWTSLLAALRAAGGPGRGDRWLSEIRAATILITADVLAPVSQDDRDLAAVLSAPLVELTRLRVRSGQWQAHVAARDRIMMAQQLYDRLPTRYWRPIDEAASDRYVALRARGESPLPNEWVVATIAVYGEDVGEQVLREWRRTLEKTDALLLKSRRDLSGTGGL